jgi:hypothetical protein
MESAETLLRVFVSFLSPSGHKQFFAVSLAMPKTAGTPLENKIPPHCRTAAQGRDYGCLAASRQCIPTGMDTQRPTLYLCTKQSLSCAHHTGRRDRAEQPGVGAPCSAFFCIKTALPQATMTPNGRALDTQGILLALADEWAVARKQSQPPPSVTSLCRLGSPALRIPQDP